MPSRTFSDLLSWLPPSPGHGGVGAPPPPPPPLFITPSTVAALLAEDPAATGGWSVTDAAPEPVTRKPASPRKAATKKKARAATTIPGGQTSAYTGVTRHGRSGRWEAHVWTPALRRQVFAGAWYTEIGAAAAFDLVRIASRYDARHELALNFPLSAYGDAEIAALASVDLDALVLALRAQAAAGDAGPRVAGVVV